MLAPHCHRRRCFVAGGSRCHRHEQLEELEKAVAVAERDPKRFCVDPPEIAARRQWISDTHNQILGIQRRLAAATAEKPVRDGVAGAAGGTRRELVRPAPGKSTAYPSSAAADLDEDGFSSGAADRQALLLREQDQDLDDLSATVERLGDVGLTIHDELGKQDRILDELVSEMDVTSSRLDYVQKKMAAVIKKAGVKGQLLMIVFLVMLLVSLIVLVFYG
eukprot:SM000003S11163  [mRNA]  locus=s3:1290435:1291836:+ [translate_table: standard]